jgi:hypothetical protein
MYIFMYICAERERLRVGKNGEAGKGNNRVGGGIDRVSGVNMNVNVSRDLSGLHKMESEEYNDSKYLNKKKHDLINIKHKNDSDHPKLINHRKDKNHTNTQVSQLNNSIRSSNGSNHQSHLKEIEKKITYRRNFSNELNKTTLLINPVLHGIKQRHRYLRDINEKNQKKFNLSNGLTLVRGNRPLRIVLFSRGDSKPFPSNPLPHIFL